MLKRLAMESGIATPTAEWAHPCLRACATQPFGLP